MVFSGIYPNQLFYSASLPNEFGTKAFCSLFERRVKTENYFSTFAVEGLINSEILKSIKFQSFNFFGFWGHCLGHSHQSTCMEFALDTALYRSSTGFQISIWYSVQYSVYTGVFVTE